MAFVESPSFPATLAFGATGGPRFSTGLVKRWGGDEQRNMQWDKPLHTYQLSLAPRKADDTFALFNFFHTVAVGQVNAFRFPDFNAGEDFVDNEVLGEGTDASAEYQLIKTYRAAAMYTSVRTITKPRVGTLIVTIDDVPTTSYSVDTATGIITLTAAAGTTIRATCRFDVPVRFTSDRLPITRIDGGYQWGNVDLIESREI